MPTTKAHFEAIGRVAYEWSRLEMFAQTLIAGAANIPHDISLILTNSGNIRIWMEIVRRLAEHSGCPDDIRQRLRTVSHQIENDLLADRNKVIHGLWGLSWQEVFGDRFKPPDDLKSKLTSLRKSGPMLKEFEMTAADVEAIADRIKQALDDLQCLTVVLIDALRNKPPQPSG